jgi:prepilin-type N-terminal cleavage/methylation domain-containing protein
MFVAKTKFNTGFTLVELLVTISIFVLLTGIVLFNQTKFNSTILLTNLAYDTGLTIRQAQNYGINIKEFNSTGALDGGKFLPYGVHFEKGAKSFILFTDIDSVPNGIFDGATTTCHKSEGCVTRYNIKRGNYIKEICSKALGVADVTCSGTADSKDKLDIVFVRPNPDAEIRFNGSLLTQTSPVATIILGGVEAGSIRKVVVRRNGLIEIIN